MSHSSLHRAQSNSVLRAADTTHNASPSVPAFEPARHSPQSSFRIPRKAKSSPKLSQHAATVTDVAEPEASAPAPIASKGAQKISEFASKFRFFKARRTDSASCTIDGLPSSSSSTLAKFTASDSTHSHSVNSPKLQTVTSLAPLRTGSKLRKTNYATTTATVHARNHRANTAPSVSGTKEAALIGLGITDLRLDVRTGKYYFQSNGHLPGAQDMERSRSSSGGSSAEESGGPSTPTESIPSLPGSGALEKTFAHLSIDEAGSQEFMGVFKSLFPSRGDDIGELPQEPFDTSVAEGCSPILRPVDSSSSIPVTRRRRTNSSNVRSTPIAHQLPPARSSSLRGSGFQPRNKTLSTMMEQ